jgi:hypothetical protein
MAGMIKWANTSCTAGIAWMCSARIKDLCMFSEGAQGVLLKNHVTWGWLVSPRSTALNNNNNNFFFCQKTVSFDHCPIFYLSQVCERGGQF